MKTKIYKTFILVTVLVSGFTGCNEETIELEPVGSTEASFFKNETQFDQAVLGAYQKLTFFYTFRSGNPLNVLWLLPSDDITTQAGVGYENFVALNGGDARVGTFYQYAYQLIARANTILSKIESDGDVAYTNPALRDNHKGEALFLRAYMNFILWNTFGTAPVINIRITSLDDAYPPSSTGTQLLDQAILDLEEAKSLLPDSRPASQKGRVTKNSARALQGKVLVFRGTVNNSQADFTAAIAAFDAITGVALMSNYNSNFDIASENNNESLFEFQANSNTGNNNPFLDNDGFAVVGDISHYIGHFNLLPGYIGNALVSATPSLINAYEAGDPRIQYVLNPASSSTNIIKYIKSGAYTSNSFGPGNGLSVNNPRILRYADVLLLKAEALVRSGGSLTDAITIVNSIRNRARNSTGTAVPSAVPADRDPAVTDPDVVLEWIFDERRLELAIEEGHRWYDLRRRHIIGEIDLTSFDFSSSRPDVEFKEFNINYPLPNREVLDNSNLKQNTGY